MKNKILLIVTSILLVISLVIGTSYALWLISEEQLNKNIVGSECFDITFTEDSEDISLLGTFPMIDSDGMETEPFTFTVSNICDVDAGYQVNLEVLSTTTLDHSLIKGVLDNNIPSVMTDLDVVEAVNENATAYKFDIYPLAAGTSATHDFRMWIDEAGTLANSQNKTISAKITIIAAPDTQLVPDYVDSGVNGANPAFMNNMIPIEDGLIADVSSDWYNYEEGRIANVMLTTQSDADTYDSIIGSSKDTITNNGEYVWIPRFKYDSNGIVFESSDTPKSTGDGITSYKTHDAFTQDGVELDGFWVSKYFLSNDSDTVSLDETSLLYSVSGSDASMYSTNTSATYDDINDFNNYINELDNNNSYELPSIYEIHGMSLVEESAMKIFASYYNTNTNNHYKYNVFPYDTSVQVDSNASGIHNIIENDYDDTIAYDADIKIEKDTTLVNNKDHFENIVPKVEFLNQNVYSSNGIEKIVVEDITPPTVFDTVFEGGGSWTLGSYTTNVINVGYDTPDSFSANIIAVDPDGNEMIFSQIDNAEYLFVKVGASTGLIEVSLDPEYFETFFYTNQQLISTIEFSVIDSYANENTFLLDVLINTAGLSKPIIEEINLVPVVSDTSISFDGTIVVPEHYPEIEGLENLRFDDNYFSVTNGIGNFGTLSIINQSNKFSYVLDNKYYNHDMMYTSDHSFIDDFVVNVSNDHGYSANNNIEIKIDSFGYRGHRAVIVEK